MLICYIYNFDCPHRSPRNKYNPHVLFSRNLSRLFFRLRSIAQYINTSDSFISFSIFADPKSNNPSYQIMYHPQTGQCVHGNQPPVYLTDCQNWSKWSYDRDGGPIRLLGSTPSCLSVAGDGLPVGFSDDCSGQQSIWTLVSGSKFHIAAKDEQGSLLCLDLDSSSSSSGISIVTKKCLCLGNDAEDVPMCVENPQRQWFTFITSNTWSMIVMENCENRKHLKKYHQTLGVTGGHVQSLALWPRN